MIFRRSAVAILLLAVACGRGTTAPRADGTALPRCKARGIIGVGRAVPSCSFRVLGGGTIDLASLKGTPVVLNFWASWCTFCVAEMPAFEATNTALAGKIKMIGADLLGIEGETEAAAQNFARSTGVRYPLILDEGGLLYAHFSPRLLMPTTIFIDRGGIVRHRVFGPLKADELRHLISAHLGVAG